MRYLILFIIVLLQMNLFSQEVRKDSFAVKSKRKRMDIDMDNIYHRITGDKIIPNQFIELVGRNPKLPIEIKYNKFGEAVRFFIEPSSKKTPNEIISESRAKVGDILEDFHMTSTDGFQLNSQALKGKYVLLYFVSFLDDIHVNKARILDLNQRITDNQLNEAIEFIFVSRNLKQEGTCAIYSGSYEFSYC